MSLDKDDLQAIRVVVREEVAFQINAGLAPIERRLGGVESRLDIVDGRLEALENDTRDIFLMLSNAGIRSLPG